MDEKRICENCRYFSAHYIKNKYGRIERVHCGNCLHIDVQDRVFRKYYTKKLETCDKWEFNQIQIQKRRENIIDKLERMCTYIEQVVICLQDDREYLDGKKEC